MAYSLLPIIFPLVSILVTSLFGRFFGRCGSILLNTVALGFTFVAVLFILSWSLSSNAQISVVFGY